MTSNIQRVLSGSFSVSIARRIAERGFSLSMQTVLSRLAKFAVGGAVGLLAAVTMFFIARADVVDLPHTKLLVTLVLLSGLAIALGSLVASLTLLWDGLLGQYARRLAAESELAEAAEAQAEQTQKAEDSAESPLAESLAAARSGTAQPEEEISEPVTVQVRETLDELIVSIAKNIEANAGRGMTRREFRRVFEHSRADEFHIPISEMGIFSSQDLRTSIADVIRTLSTPGMRTVSSHDRRIVRQIRKLSEPSAIESQATYSLLIQILLEQARTLVDGRPHRTDRSDRFRRRFFPNG